MELRKGTVRGFDAGTYRATVDERLGDLEVSLRDRGLRLLGAGDRVALATGQGRVDDAEHLGLPRQPTGDLDAAASVPFQARRPCPQAPQHVVGGFRRQPV